MNYWLIKSEPATYSWDDFVKLGRDHWDGVRNYQARNNMKEMKKDDQVLFYHSGDERAVVGTAQVAKEFYPDPTIDDDRWVAVELMAGKKLTKPVTLVDIKSDKRLSEIHLVKNSRLSVMPLKKAEYDMILEKSI